jgi:hypothetical protein
MDFSDPTSRLMIGRVQDIELLPRIGKHRSDGGQGEAATAAQYDYNGQILLFIAPPLRSKNFHQYASLKFSKPCRRLSNFGGRLISRTEHK